jgi:LAS superfamily LD-carboxypeptidase LdcB
MSEKKLSHYQKYITTPVLLVVLLVLVAGIGGYFLYKNIKELNLTKSDLASTTSSLIQLQAKAQKLSDDLDTERYINSRFSGQISEIAGTVGKLDQLSKTDKELLQKYSKVYFLSENYVPESLTDIPTDYLYDKTKETKMHTKAFPFLRNMIVAAKMDGINLEIISAYRSFGQQSALKNNYTVVYGSGANTFSADQGYSEHQLGTAIDFTTAELGANYSDFEKSSAYNWLLKNAYKYGFILSYPKGNAYYQFEPWHWRFIGRSLADTLHQENKNFYDLDQRNIDNYLINIFD